MTWQYTRSEAPLRARAPVSGVGGLLLAIFAPLHWAFFRDVLIARRMSIAPVSSILALAAIALCVEGAVAATHTGANARPAIAGVVLSFGFLVLLVSFAT